MSSPPGQVPPFFPRNWKKVCAWVGGAFCLSIFFIWFHHTTRFVHTNDAHLDGYQITISPDIEGRVVALFVDEGDFVQEGDLLCLLDSSILESKREEAMTYISFLDTNIELHKIAWDKQRELYTVALGEWEHQIISPLSFQIAEKDLHWSEANYKAAVAQHANGCAKLGIIEEMLEHTKIYAPSRGWIAKRWTAQGDVARVSQPLFSLTTSQSLWVTALIEETQIKKVTQGAPTSIRVDAYPHLRLEGTVGAVRASAASQFSLFPPDNATGNFTKVVQRIPVKIVFTPPDISPPLHLYPGMSVEVTISTP